MVVSAQQVDRKPPSAWNFHRRDSDGAAGCLDGRHRGFNIVYEPVRTHYRQFGRAQWRTDADQAAPVLSGRACIAKLRDWIAENCTLLGVRGADAFYIVSDNLKVVDLHLGLRKPMGTTAP
jgi:hypothetical protein